MKKLLVFLLVVGLLVGCNKQDNNNKEGNEVYLTFDGYGLHGGMLEVNTTTNTFETGSMDLVSLGNQTIQEVFELNEVVSIGAFNEYDTFEGWLVFKTEIYTDSDGFDTIIQTLESSKLYSTDEILGYTMPNYNITIVAKWAEMDITQYYVEDDFMIDSSTTGTLVFNANGGVIELESTYDKGLLESVTYAFWMKDGECVNDLLTLDSWHTFKEVVQEDKVFAGWQLYEGTSLSWSNEQSKQENVTSFAYDPENVDFRYVLLEDCKSIEGLKTTEELHAMQIYSTCYYAEAVWK